MNPETGKTPNKHTIYMGKMIREARENLGMSQEELAEKIYRRRLAVSEMENGKVEISAWTLPLLSHALKKPLSYFFPPFLITDIPEVSLSAEEHELITYYRNVYDKYLGIVAIKIMKSISEYEPIDLMRENLNHAIDHEDKEEMQKLLLKKKPEKD